MPIDIFLPGPIIIAKHTMSQDMKSAIFHGIRPNDPDGRRGLRNPERGFRFEILVGQIPSDIVTGAYLRDPWPFPRYTCDGVAVTQAYCYLLQFAESEIPQEKIDALEADFARARKDGVKFLLRFAYEFGGIRGTGPTTERILAHIRQLTPVVRRNTDVIYALQIGWVGAWGEFHSSTHKIEQRPAEYARIVAATLEMLPECRRTMMRYPNRRSLALAELGDDREVTPETALSQAPHARIGHFNDAFLSTYADAGTFGDPPLFTLRGDPTVERVGRESAFLPMDGELYWTGGANPDRASGIRVIARLSLHHYTTFSLVHSNSELDQRQEKWTIDTWKEQPITPAVLEALDVAYDPGYFAGTESRTAYEFIRDHLGYRLALDLVEYQRTAAPGEPYRIKAVINNFGFSAPVNERHPEFVLVGADGAAVELPTSFDCRAMQPSAYGARRTQVLSHLVRFNAPLPARLPAGNLRLALWFPDAAPSLRYRPEYAIRLASQIPVENVGGRLLHFVGTIPAQ